MDTLPPAAAITPQRLALVAPHCDAAAWSAALTAAAARRNINTARRVRHWLAHLIVECAGFTRLDENLIYTHAEVIQRTWPRRFPTVDSARAYVRNPQTLANKVYGGRGGNVGPNDGWLYRGRGPIGRTFRDGYGQASQTTGVDVVANPDLLQRPDIGALDAAAFWELNGLNAIADEDADEAVLARAATTLAQRVRLNEEDDLEAETRKVNGGLLGLDDRRAALIACEAVWPG